MKKKTVIVTKEVTSDDKKKYAAVWGNCPKKRKVFLTILYMYLWCVWKARNEMYFHKIWTSKAKMADNITTTVFESVKHRGNYMIVIGRIGFVVPLIYCNFVCLFICFLSRPCFFIGCESITRFKRYHSSGTVYPQDFPISPNRPLNFLYQTQ
ncbi:hypothetical protein LXL04_011365 [Taraxacum kok-saghyz]